MSDRIAKIIAALGGSSNDPNENEFQSWIKATPWYHEFKSNYNEEPNLDDASNYDYRAAYRDYKQGKWDFERDPTDNNRIHWPSEYKGQNDTRLILDGVNTKTGKPATPEEMAYHNKLIKR